MDSVALPRTYYRVVGASGVSNLADGIRMAAFPLLAATLTDSAAVIGLVFAAGQAPWLLFGLWAGKLSDRMDRRRLAQRVAFIRASLLALLAVLVLVGLAPLWLIIIATFVLGVGEVLADNVSGTLIPLLVSDEDLERANSRMVGATIAGNELIGPVIGGLLFAAGASLPFFTNASLLACAFLLLAGLPVLEQAQNEVINDAADAAAEPSAFDGIPFIRSRPLLMTLTWTTAALAAVDAAWFALLVLFVRDQLGYGAAGFGLLLAAGAIGGLGGAAFADRRPGISLAAISWTVFLSMSVSLVALGAFPNPLVSVAALVVSSAGFALWNVFMSSARQRATPNHLLGRVGAAHRTIVVTASLLGAIVGGIIADQASIQVALITYGALLAALSPFAARRFASPKPAAEPV